MMASSVETVSAFALFAIVCAITPGPNNVLLVSAGHRCGVSKGLTTLLGVSIGFSSLFFLLAYFSVNVFAEVPVLLTMLRAVGIGFLLYLAYQIARAPVGTEFGPDDSKNRFGFWTAFAFQWLNPKAWIVSVSAVSTYVSASAAPPFAAATLFASIFLVTVTVGCFPWLVLGSMSRALFRTTTQERVFNLTMAALLIVSVVFIVF